MAANKKREQDDLPQFAKNITRIREMRSMSKSELSRRSGVSQPSITLYESGRRRPKIEQVEKLAAALGVRPAEIDRACHIIDPRAPDQLFEEPGAAYLDRFSRLEKWLREEATPAQQNLIFATCGQLGFKNREKIDESDTVGLRSGLETVESFLEKQNK